MSIIGFILKTYVAILLLRSVMTRQELYFNSVGKFIASATEPIFGTFLKSVPKEKADKYIPLLIGIITLLYGIIDFAITSKPLVYSVLIAIHEMTLFLMLFYVVSIILGSFVNTYGASVYTTYFYRLGLFWVKLARGMINIPGNKIIIVAIFIIFAAFVIADFFIWSAITGLTSGSFIWLYSLKLSVKAGLFGFVILLNYFKWLIIIRVLMTWVSPDPRNPIVQMIASLTDPVMEPFRKVIPPLGIIDISPIVLIFLVETLRIFLANFIGKIL
jgi:YggT family protein